MVPPREPGKRGRPWWARDTRRATAGQRGYDWRWQQASAAYRKEHPLCVMCALAGYMRPSPSQCVDHIVPIHSCPELQWEVENFAALCFVSHGAKTRKEPRESWEPRRDRIVVCGLPGTGKTTFARESGLPYWDADDHPALVEIEDIQQARAEWIDRQRGACIVIVASIVTASQLANRLRGVAKHLTERFVEREPRRDVSR